MPRTGGAPGDPRTARPFRRCRWRATPPWPFQAPVDLGGTIPEDADLTQLDGLVSGEKFKLDPGFQVDIQGVGRYPVPSPVLTSVQQSGGTYGLRVDQVLQPGTLIIEAWTNLAGWSLVATNTTSANVFFYTDPNMGNHRQRLYRAFQFPRSPDDTIC